MKIKFITTGKTVEKYLVDGIAGYEKRIKKYVNFETVVLKDLKNAANMSFNTIKAKEAEMMLPYLNSSCFRILLDEKGVEFSSKEFATFLEKKMSTDGRDIIFVVGGPYGFDKIVYDNCDFKISLSKMTFSHQMVRLVFTEQLYRAFTILNNEPYHHE